MKTVTGGDGEQYQPLHSLGRRTEHRRKQKTIKNSQTARAKSTWCRHANGGSSNLATEEGAPTLTAYSLLVMRLMHVCTLA